MKFETLPSLFLIVGAFAMAQANQEALLAVTDGNKLFSCHLYDVIRKEKGNSQNLVVSPISVSTAVAMLQAGAREETATAIRSSLHFPADEQMNLGYQSLIQKLHGDKDITLEMVNRIYPAEGFQLNPEFSATLKKYFAAEPHQLNYTKNVEAAKEINSFVSKSTHGKIPELIKASSLDGTTALVLINAIYFKGNWKHQFPHKDTRKEDFYTSEATSVKVDMMKLKTHIFYADIPELDAQVVSLPYKGDHWSMVVMLPNKRTGLAEMEEKLKSVPLDKIMGSLKKEKVKLYLPKFKLESTIDLQKPLTELGAGVIFDAVRANLTGLAAGPVLGNLYVSQAIQKAFIEVNEEGSEAAAATVIGVVNKVALIRIGDPEPVVRVDHPFYSMIVYGDTTGTPSHPIIPVFAQRVAYIE